MAGEPSSVAARSDVLFDGEALVAGRTRRIRCILHPDDYEIRIEGAGAFAVARAGGAVTVLRGEPRAESDLAAALAGPPLALGFALRGVFCLHASAVASDGRAVAFAGESGAGKSTLAAGLATLPGWQRLADDLLPVALGPGGPEARPGFPQPGIGPAAALPERLPLAAVYLLAGPAGEVAITPLAGRAGALALVRHTVAARLFAPDLLARHLEHAAAVAAAAPVRTLTYPWTREALAETAAALAADLERGDG